MSTQSPSEALKSGLPVAVYATGRFIESLRERLIYHRELLDEDGSIYMHLDQKMSHYAKIIMDEVFGRSCFLNEIIWKRTYAHSDAKQYGVIHDTILYYSIGKRRTWNVIRTAPDQEYIETFFDQVEEETGRRYARVDLTAAGVTKEGESGKPWRSIDPKSKGRHWAYHPNMLEEFEKQNRIHWPKKGVPRRKNYADEHEGVTLQDIWIDIRKIHNQSPELIGYPTQKPESLIERIILASSNPGDLVMDLFGGSGTTAVVAEKLDRRWITCDFGKHAIYTVQKRILNIAESKKLGTKEIEDETRCAKCRSIIEESANYKKCSECQTLVKKVNKPINDKYDKKPKPFCVVSSGAYDFSHIMDLRKHKETYIDFVLGLFQLASDEEKASKYKLANIYAVKDNNPVEVYPIWDDQFLKEVKIDETYLRGIIVQSGGKLRGDYYIITPESCTNVGDTTLKNQDGKDVNFQMLTFPYKVLEDVSRNLELQEQPSSQANVNTLITSTAYYFNEDVEITAARTSDGLRITKFETIILNKEGKRFEGFSGLSMLLVDLDYEAGKPFDMDKTLFAKEIAEDGSMKIEGLTRRVGLIAIDKHGNESKPFNLK